MLAYRTILTGASSASFVCRLPVFGGSVNRAAKINAEQLEKLKQFAERKEIPEKKKKLLEDFIRRKSYGLAPKKESQRTEIPGPSRQLKLIRADPRVVEYLTKHRLGFSKLDKRTQVPQHRRPPDPLPPLTALDRVFERKLVFKFGAKNAASFPPESGIPEVAFVGRSNVGKSSLINAIAGGATAAKVSDLPGYTRQINWYYFGTREPPPLALVDLPGYGFAFADEEEKQQWGNTMREFVRTRKSLKRIFLLIDARSPGLKAADYEMISSVLEKAGTRFQVVVTKCDLLQRHDLAKLASLLHQNLKSSSNVIRNILFVSSKQFGGIYALRKEIGQVINWRERAFQAAGAQSGAQSRATTTHQEAAANAKQPNERKERPPKERAAGAKQAAEEKKEKKAAVQKEQAKKKPVARTKDGKRLTPFHAKAEARRERARTGRVRDAYFDEELAKLYGEADRDEVGAAASLGVGPAIARLAADRKAAASEPQTSSASGRASRNVDSRRDSPTRERATERAASREPRDSGAAAGRRAESESGRSRRTPESTSEHTAATPESGRVGGSKAGRRRSAPRSASTVSRTLRRR